MSARAPASRRRAAPAHRHRRRADVTEEVEDTGVPTQRTVEPPDRLKLTPKELSEGVVQVLTANDPNLATGLVCYSFADGTYKPLPSSTESEHVAFHFSMDGMLLSKDSDEGASQLASERATRRLIADRRRELEKRALEEQKAVEELEEEIGDAGGRNQFNYSERAAQTYNAPMKDRTVTTKPPDTAVFAEALTQWDVYDAYVEEYERMVEQEELEKGGSKPSGEAAGGGGAAGGSAALTARKGKDKKSGEAIVHSEACGWSLKIVERMASQNAQDELYADFKYWEDASDAFRPGGMGTLLPLWRFSDTRVKKKMVTALAWNPRYPDLFAVGYGSYDFMRQGSGLLCVYTLKNVSYPEYMFSLESGVMCLDWHPDDSALLAVGCYDGTVRVFDVRRKENRALYAADIKSGKHTDPVWEVRWQEDDLGKNLAFFSVSSDGRVASWVLSKNELQMEVVMSLKLVQGAPADAVAGGAPAATAAGGAGGAEGGAAAAAAAAAAASVVVAEDEWSLTGLAGGCCFDFNPYSEHLFLVGTEEGRIHKCSKAYSGQYLETYEGHHMAVYAVKWNPFHERVFMSCSADWTVKIWDHMCPQAVMTFDLQNAVGDIAWAPYSSTVFAAVTSNGKALVFDLNVNKHEQLCEQKIVKKAKLTHVSFARNAPLLLVGDSHGGVTSLKLSPNLRKIQAIPVPEVLKKGEAPPEPPSRLEVEVTKLNALMSAADVKAAVPITLWTGKAAVKEEAAAVADADA